MKYFPQFSNPFDGWNISNIYCIIGRKFGSGEGVDQQTTLRRQVQPPRANQPWLRNTAITNRTSRTTRNTRSAPQQTITNIIPNPPVQQRIPQQTTTSTNFPTNSQIYNSNPFVQYPNTPISSSGQSTEKKSKEVDEWLKSINMETYIETFRQNDVHELSVVQKINIEELKNDLKITSFGDRKKLFFHIKKLSEKNQSTDRVNLHVSSNQMSQNLMEIELTSIKIKIGQNTIGKLFDSNLKIHSIYEFVKSCLKNPEIDFELILPQVFERDHTIKSCGLFPKVLLIAKTKDKKQKFELKSKFLKKKREDESGPRKKPKIE
jgi:hypothetical protein